MEIDVARLTNKLLKANIQISGCNSNGIVWDLSGNEIQNNNNVKIIIQNYTSLSIDELDTILQLYFDKIVSEKNYKDMDRITTFVESTNVKWAAEARAAIEWRDNCWNKFHEIENKGEPYPTEEQFIAQLPILIWPD